MQDIPLHGCTVFLIERVARVNEEKSPVLLILVLLPEEDWGFLFIDTRKVFNEENRTEMLWAIRYEWPSGAQFTYNCYRHWSTLVVRNTKDGSGHFLHSKEGVTQEDPLAMIVGGLLRFEKNLF